MADKKRGVVPVGKQAAKSQESSSGGVPKGGNGSSLFSGSVDEHYRDGKPGLPYSGA